MLRENEVVMLLLGIGVLFLIFVNLDHIKKIKSWKTLTSAYFVLLFGWIFTVLEGFFLDRFLNLLEHLSYFISAVFMIAWCWKATEKAKEEETA
jgi:dolichyl-phosphate-mannose--protein O-mannosyl transferase